MTKRICLFAGYNVDNVLCKYVLKYLQELSNYADIYYFADGELTAKQITTLQKFVIKADGKRHGKYDFGSWSEIIKSLGWEKIAQYDELILVNDSCLGGIFPLKKMMETMSSQNLDAWGSAGNHFIMSFFVCMRKKVFLSSQFRYFIEHIQYEENKNSIIKKYEYGLNRILQQYNVKVYLSKQNLNNFYQTHKEEIEQEIKQVVPWYCRPFFIKKHKKINFYEDNAIIPLMMQFPLVKRNNFKNKNSFFAVFGKTFIKRNSSYPIEYIDEITQGQGVRIGDVFLSRIAYFCKSFLYEIKFKKEYKIIRIFKIPIYRKKMNYTI